MSVSSQSHDQDSRASSSSLAIGAISTKRKVINDTEVGQPLQKRAKVVYKDAYRKLLNSTLDEITASPSNGKTGELSSSQIGASVWSAEEKERFFDAVARRGRHDLHSIALHIGSKSKPEIVQYLSLLKTSLIERELNSERPLRPPNLDASLELSEQCCAALDSSADALSYLQQQVEQRAERIKGGRRWLLNLETVKWVDGCLKHKHKFEELSQQLPAAELLDLKNFLSLSCDLFMNSGDLDYNYRTHREEEQSPSMLYSAFSDFHTLTISITKRLIQSCLFIAMSRMRASKFPGARQRPTVRATDVDAALKIVGMTKDKNAYWSGLARRCKLQVYEDTTIEGENFTRCYSLDQVEKILDPDDDAGSDIGAVEAETQDDSDDLGSLEVNAADIQDDSDSTQYSPSTTAEDSPQSEQATASSSDIWIADKEERQEALMDQYLEALDTRNSRAEELRLWELLEQTPANEDAAKEVNLPKAPGLARKDKQEHTDWTDWTDYRAEWETIEMQNRRNEASELTAG